MTDFGNSDHTPLGEDALYEALVAAKSREEFRQADEALVGGSVVDRPEWARALLEAARWFREHGYLYDGCGLNTDSCFTCAECESRRPSHEPSCEVGSWVRAAARVGL